ncbi:MAG: hypothetical protein M3347_10435 [Armatimonadota bacterium]|nr:hypothetical protein [Armatimonadota bacterium]
MPDKPTPAPTLEPDYTDLKAWMTRFKRIARVALRDQPALAQKLQL